ncbi:RluA family pseudouridine synthase [Paenibacillus beijingensis]|uniref:Pseudouridine synthase n=1 Tax=Paenibacillus beijingensis TaxID=1126833 RepID=A0A0D5NLA3_9BACL|nr:RluA family pseudouridine synthase [Paenibacillus beijingensis]AJY76051.1 hypothetical protein VN24_17680 [Paenibacillus beijingensis]
MFDYSQALRKGEWLEIPLSALALTGSESKGAAVPAGLSNPDEGAVQSEPESRPDEEVGPSEAGSDEREGAAPLGAGSHPHEVRQRLLALSLFPAKWINRLFSVGGIRLEGETVRLLAFPAANPAADPLYRQAAEALRELKRREEKPGSNGRPDKSGSLKAAGAAIVPILYQDDYCMVLDKPAGMPVHASFPGQRGTLDEAAALHCLLAGDPLPVRHVHRLDEDTSGPVLYTKNDLSQLRLDEEMRHKRIDRQYIALVEGIPARSRGTVRAPIGKDRHHRSRRRVHPGGDEAVTHYEVAERFAAAALLRLRLETGRTHQIRVHMSHLGHPLIGDTLYGGSAGLLGHQALHGEKIIFTHPLSGDRMEIVSPVPEWFEAVRSRLKG